MVEPEGQNLVTPFSRLPVEVSDIVTPELEVVNFDCCRDTDPHLIIFHQNQHFAL